MHKIIISMFLFIFAFSLIANDQKLEVKSPEDLKNLFIEYHKSKNIDGMLSLFCVDNTPDEMKPHERRKKIFSENMQFEIMSIEIKDLTKEDISRYTKGTPYKDGTLYWVNLEPVKKLSVTFNDPKGSRTQEEIIGKKDSLYMFCNPALKK